jgi:hypothetical protein
MTTEYRGMVSVSGTTTNIAGVLIPILFPDTRHVDPDTSSVAGSRRFFISQTCFKSHFYFLKKLTLFYVCAILNPVTQQQDDTCPKCSKKQKEEYHENSIHSRR